MSENRWSISGLISLRVFDLIASLAAIIAVYAYFSEAEDRKLNRMATSALAKEMLYVRLDRNRNQPPSKFEIAETFETLRGLGVQTSSIDLSNLSFYKLVIRPFDTILGDKVTIYQCRYEAKPGYLGSIYFYLTQSTIANCTINGAEIFMGDISGKPKGPKTFDVSYGYIANASITCGYKSEIDFSHMTLKNVRFKNCRKNQIKMEGVSVENVDLRGMENLEFVNSCVGENVTFSHEPNSKKCNQSNFSNIPKS